MCTLTYQLYAAVIIFQRKDLKIDLSYTRFLPSNRRPLRPRNATIHDDQDEGTTKWDENFASIDVIRFLLGGVYIKKIPALLLNSKHRMLSLSVIRLTRQFGATNLRFAGRLAGDAAVRSGLPALSCQSFATNRKVIDAKNVKRLKIQAKKKKTATTQVNEPLACV